MLVKYSPENMYPPRESALDLIHVKFMVGGVHEVRESDWKKVADHPIVQLYLADRVLEVIMTTPDDVPTMIDGVGVIPAISLIENTLDLPMLIRWQQNDTRPPVLKAIADQIASIRDPNSDNPGRKRGKIIALS